MKDNKFTSPGGWLKYELKQRGLTQKAFAEVAGLQRSHVSEILSNTRTISLTLASKIQEILGISAKTLLELQVEYKASHLEDAAEAQAKDELDRLDEIISVKSFLNNELRNLSAVDKLNILKRKFGIGNKSELLKACGYFRKSYKTGGDARMINTWIAKARAEIRKCPAPMPFYPASIEAVKKELSAIFHDNTNTIFRVMQTLNQHGIKFCIVEKEEHASIDGYSCFEDGIPAIAITRRFNRIDNLAFSIMHEVCHVYKHLTKDDTPRLTVTETDEEAGVEREEKEANEFAAEALIPQKEWDNTPSVPLNPYRIKKEYSRWAAEHGYNKWIVLGRVSHETGMYKFQPDDSRYIN